MNDITIIAVDFDGTLCEEMTYPEIGEPNTELIEWLVSRRKSGKYRLILWTCRCGSELVNAINWCAEQGLEFDAINGNLPENIEKYGNDSRKVFADIYIDDRSGDRGFFNLPYHPYKNNI